MPSWMLGLCSRIYRIFEQYPLVGRSDQLFYDPLVSLVESTHCSGSSCNHFDELHKAPLSLYVDRYTTGVDLRRLSLL